MQAYCLEKHVSHSKTRVREAQFFNIDHLSSIMKHFFTLNYNLVK